MLDLFEYNLPTLSKIAILNIVISWQNSKVNTILIERLNNRKPFIKNILTIYYVLHENFHQSGSKILYRNTNINALILKLCNCNSSYQYRKYRTSKPYRTNESQIPYQISTTSHTTHKTGDLN